MHESYGVKFIYGRAKTISDNLNFLISNLRTVEPHAVALNNEKAVIVKHKIDEYIKSYPVLTQILEDHPFHWDAFFASQQGKQDFLSGTMFQGAYLSMNVADR